MTSICVNCNCDGGGLIDLDHVFRVVEPLKDAGVDDAVDRPHSSSIFSATLCALTGFCVVMRMLIGVDLPSFIAARIMPPASKANSRGIVPVDW